MGTARGQVKSNGFWTGVVLILLIGGALLLMMPLKKSEPLLAGENAVSFDPTEETYSLRSEGVANRGELPTDTLRLELYLIGNGDGTKAAEEFKFATIDVPKLEAGQETGSISRTSKFSPPKLDQNYSVKIVLKKRDGLIFSVEDQQVLSYQYSFNSKEWRRWWQKPAFYMPVAGGSIVLLICATGAVLAFRWSALFKPRPTKEPANAGSSPAPLQLKHLPPPVQERVVVKRCHLCDEWKDLIEPKPGRVRTLCCPECGATWALQIDQEHKTSERRTNLAWSLSENRELSLKGWNCALALYLEAHDSGDHRWHNILGIIYDNPKNPHFDPVRANRHFLRSAELGSPFACYNLATRHAHGYYGKVDYKRAKFWYALAAERGHGCALEHLFHYQLHDARFERNGDKDYTAKIYQDLLEAEQRMGSWDWLVLGVAWLYASGRGVEKNAEEAISRYKRLIESEITCDKPPRYYAMMCLAIRYLFGLDVPKDWDYALKLLDRIPASHSEVKVHFTLNWQKKKLVHYIKSGGHQSSLILENISLIYKNQQSLPDLKRKLLTGEVPVNDEVMLLLWAISILGSNEKWEHLGELVSTRVELEQKSLNLTARQIEISTYSQGPRYSRISSNGYPVLGDPASKDEDSEILNRYCVGYIPKPGIIRLKGFTAENEGVIQFDFERSQSLPALITEEDVRVALVLAFSEDNPIYPWLSIEPLDIPTPEKPEMFHNRKEWNPEWLGHTDFGRTLYFCDQLIGSLAWNAGGFQCEPDKQEFRNLLNDISLTGGRPGEGHNGRVCLKPLHVQMKWQVDRNKWECEIVKTTMGVDGAYTVFTGTEKQDTLLNDKRYENGRLAGMLTNNYDLIAQALPVFERARQLMTLVYAMSELKKQGFQYDYFQQTMVNQDAATFKASPKLKPEEIVVENI